MILEGLTVDLGVKIGLAVGHDKRIHKLEVEQARISQWKKDKEDGV